MIVSLSSISGTGNGKVTGILGEGGEIGATGWMLNCISNSIEAQIVIVSEAIFFSASLQVDVDSIFLSQVFCFLLK